MTVVLFEYINDGIKIQEYRKHVNRKCNLSGILRAKTLCQGQTILL